jgi:hypothetical protein
MKIIKFDYNGRLVLLSLNQISFIEFIEGDGASGFGYQMIVYTTSSEKNGAGALFSFYLKKKNKDQIVLAIEDFYSNDLKVWNIDDELPFIR